MCKEASTVSSVGFLELFCVRNRGRKQPTPAVFLWCTVMEVERYSSYFSMQGSNLKDWYQGWMLQLTFASSCATIPGGAVVLQVQILEGRRKRWLDTVLYRLYVQARPWNEITLMRIKPSLSAATTVKPVPQYKYCLQYTDT